MFFSKSRLRHTRNWIAEQAKITVNFIFNLIVLYNDWMQETILLLNAHGIRVPDADHIQHSTSPRINVPPPNVVVISLCYDCIAGFDVKAAKSKIHKFMDNDKKANDFTIEAVEEIMKTGAFIERVYESGPSKPGPEADQNAASQSALEHSRGIDGSPCKTYALVRQNPQKSDPTKDVFNVNGQEYELSDDRHQMTTQKEHMFLTLRKGCDDYCIYYDRSATGLSNVIISGNKKEDELSDWNITSITESTFISTEHEPIFFNALLQKIGRENPTSINIVIAPICFSNKPVNSCQLRTYKNAYSTGLFALVIEAVRERNKQTGKGSTLQKYTDNKQLYTALATKWIN